MVAELHAHTMWGDGILGVPALVTEVGVETEALAA